MARNIEDLEKLWREIAAKEEPSNMELQQVEEVVREILTEYPLSALACELRYQRGIYTLREEEGIGSERLARALVEFREGINAADKLGDKAEPWRSLNRTQIAVCLGRLGNVKDATTELKTVSNYRPRSVMGLGALTLLVDLLKEDFPRDAKRYNNQKLSYVRALVRENKESPELPYFRLLLAEELLVSEYADEGRRLMQELASLSADVLGEDLYAEIQERWKSI